MTTQIRHNALGCFISRSGIDGAQNSGNFLQLRGVQSFSFSINNNLESYKSLGSDFSYFYLNEPTVDVNFGYNLHNGFEESVYGLSGFSGIKNLYEKEHNLHFILGDQYNDLNRATSLSGYYVASFANSVITNYSINGSVNNLVGANINLQALNFKTQQYTSGINNPTINKQNGIEDSGIISLPLFSTGFGTGVSFLLSNNVQIDINQNLTIGSSLQSGNAALESFDIGIDLSRNALQKIGYKYPYKRCLSLPSRLRINFNATFLNYEEDSIQNLFCGERFHNIDFHFWDYCRTKEIMAFQFSGLKLTNQQVEASINNRKTISFSFEKDLTVRDSFFFTKYIDDPDIFINELPDLLTGTSIYFDYFQIENIFIKNNYKILLNNMLIENNYANNNYKIFFNNLNTELVYS